MWFATGGDRSLWWYAMCWRIFFLPLLSLYISLFCLYLFRRFVGYASGCLAFWVTGIISFSSVLFWSLPVFLWADWFPLWNVCLLAFVWFDFPGNGVRSVKWLIFLRFCSFFPCFSFLLLSSYTRLHLIRTCYSTRWLLLPLQIPFPPSFPPVTFT